MPGLPTYANSTVTFFFFYTPVVIIFSAVSRNEVTFWIFPEGFKAICVLIVCLFPSSSRTPTWVFSELWHLLRLDYHRASLEAPQRRLGAGIGIVKIQGTYSFILWGIGFQTEFCTPAL